jgi:hypothetical protein
MMNIIPFEPARQLVAEALARVSEVPPEHKEAVAAAEALRMAQAIRESVDTARAVIALSAFKSGVWASHPAQPRTFRDFLRLCVDDPHRSRSWVSTINSAAEVMLYCLHCGMGQRFEQLVQERWGILAEAISALRRAMAEGPEKVATILDQVGECDSREQARAMFRTARQVRGAYGTLQTGGVAFIAIVTDPDTATSIITSLVSRGMANNLIVTQSGGGFYVGGSIGNGCDSPPCDSDHRDDQG